jgi:hypothetical protein
VNSLTLKVAIWDDPCHFLGVQKICNTEYI